MRATGTGSRSEVPCLPNLPRISAKEIVSQGLHEAANVPGFEIVVTSGSFAALHSRQCPLKAMLVENKPEQRVHSEIGSGERRFRSTGAPTKRNRKETGELGPASGGRTHDTTGLD